MSTQADMRVLCRMGPSGPHRAAQSEPLRFWTENWNRLFLPWKRSSQFSFFFNCAF